MSAPVRLQLSRKRGFDLHALSRSINGLPARSVARPSLYGNPFGWQTPQLPEHGNRHRAVEDFRRWLENGYLPTSHRSQRAQMQIRRAALLAAIEEEIIRGRNLACWCRLDQLCHADVLLEIANQ